MRNFKTESGFGLVEAVVATLMTMVGVLSVAVLFMVGARMQANATTSSGSVGLATAELERIRMLAPSAGDRALGEHTAPRGLTTVKWTITRKDDLCAPIGGVPGATPECARDIVVVATTKNGQAIQAQLRGILWR